MKRAPVIACIFALSLWAADFWQSKPFTEWSEKDVQKMLRNSPWSKEFSTALPGGGPMGGSTNRNRGGGGVTQDAASAPTNGPAGSQTQGGLGRYAGSTGDPGAQGGGSTPSITLVIRWQSATAVREAILKAKYGNEAGTSPEAKKALETTANDYVIAVSGIPRMDLGAEGDELKKKMLEEAALIIKGKPPIKAEDFMVERGRGVEMLFAFPKSTPITEDDKEVEFAVKLGDLNIKQKFRLKDMMLNGKLDL